MSYKLYDFNKDPKLDEQIRLICDLLFNKRETYSGQIASDITRPQYRTKQSPTVGGNPRWYVPYQLHWDVSAVTWSVTALDAYPFFSGNKTQITGMGIYKQDATASNYRLGIYKNLAQDDLYPTELVGAAPELVVGAVAGFYSVATTITLQPNTLYWIVGTPSVTNLVAGMAVSNCEFRSFSGMDQTGIGVPNRTASFVRVLTAYAALTNPFPSGGTTPVVSDFDASAGVCVNMYVKFA